MNTAKAILTAIVVAFSFGRAQNTFSAPLENESAIKIQPRAPRRGGVSSGLVIIYGHPIKPPYLLSFRSGKLYMNDVQVEPSLYSEREKASVSTNVYQAEFGNIAWRVGNDLQKMSRAGKTPQQILSFAKRQQGVEDAILERPDMVMLTIKSDGQLSKIGVSLPAAGSKVAIDSRDQITPAVSHEIERKMQALKEGKSVIYPASGGQIVRKLPREFKDTVLQVMHSDKDDSQRIQILAEKFFSGFVPPAEDIVKNFSEAEWD